MHSRRAVAAALIGLAIAFVVVGAAPALGSASVAPVVDYSAYPTGLVPATCEVEGEAVLVGEAFSRSGGVPVGTLGELGPIADGDVIIMTWSGYAPGCEDVGVSLARYVAPSPTFDPTKDQYLDAWVYCGPGGITCSGMLSLGSADGVACYQIDAAVGPPLAVVGPGGSFYSLNPVFDMLVSAANGGSGDCQPAPCTTTGSTAGLPASDEACPPEVTSTTTVVAPTSTVAAAVTTTTAAAPVTTAAPQQEVAASAAGSLPLTGARSADRLRVGLSLLAAGAALLLAARRVRPA